MKKLDAVIIIFILSISISFYTIFAKNSNNGDEAFIEILYKSTTIYKVKLEQDTNTIIEISSNEDIINVKEGHSINKLNIKTDRELYNVISITSKETKMIDANCEDKNIHDRMIISEKFYIPIVCFNGITVKLVKSNEEIIPVRIG